ncbi:hypothetical protein CEXT_553021 [Caerostris extrusa]|uniref:Uncharacterized protein n=1 Tax=Caerostris extrusa TaxID=172846 RepID=A0AAV4VFW7_CAEEX|nr:hypothetical protein CEXT_553021 [Caerostris extrusa]
MAYLLITLQYKNRLGKVKRVAGLTRVGLDFSSFCSGLWCSVKLVCVKSVSAVEIHCDKKNKDIVFQKLSFPR